MRPADIALLLPSVMRRTIDGAEGDVLLALLEAMAAMHGPAEAVVAGLPGHFDPRVTGDGMVAFLASWADLDRVASVGPDGVWTLPTGLGHLRELVATSIEVSRTRGTRAGLVRFLETATGTTGFEVLDASDGVQREFHLVVRLPPEAEPWRALVAQLVEAEKPAHLTFELEPAPTAPAAGGH